MTICYERKVSFNATEKSEKEKMYKKAKHMLSEIYFLKRSEHLLWTCFLESVSPEWILRRGCDFLTEPQSSKCEASCGCTWSRKSRFVTHCLGRAFSYPRTATRVFPPSVAQIFWQRCKPAVCYVQCCGGSKRNQFVPCFASLPLLMNLFQTSEVAQITWSP